MTFVFLTLVLRGLDRFTAASFETTGIEASLTQPDEPVSHGLANLVQATVPTSIPTHEHLKSDVVSAVKNDRD